MAAKVFTSILKTSPGSQTWFGSKQGSPIKDVSASFYPLQGLNPKGGIFPTAKMSDKFEKLLDHGASSESLGLVNLGDPKLQVSGDLEPTSLIARTGLIAAFLHCHKCKINPPAAGDSDPKWTANGSTTEAALKVAAWKGGLIDGEQRGEALKEKYQRETAPDLDVIFSSSSKMAASVLRLPEDDRSLEGKLRFRPEHTHFAIVLGAPDRVISRLGALLSIENGALIVDETKPSAEHIQHINTLNANLGHQALRALLLAIRPLTASDVNALKARAGNADQRMEYLLTGPLAFHGLWGIYDPPRPNIEDSIRIAHEAFIRVVMITGDQRPTAVAIGKKIGILSEYDDVDLKARMCKDMHLQQPEVVRRPTTDDAIKRRRSYSVHDIKTDKDAHENEYVDDSELNTMTQEVCVWSRAQPTDKVAIVDSLDNQELVVAMTGDGVNDAPALKRAQIGVAMGLTGTAVTKQAAAMVLRDDNFSTIVAAVSEGRKIYGNVQKYVIYNLCVKGGECLVCTIAVLANLPLPISGLPQLVNLVATHIIPPISLAWEDAESYTMKIPPRKTKGDLVVGRVLMLYRWLPFLLCYAIVICSSMCSNMYMNTGFLTVHAIVGSQQPGAIADNLAACQLAGSFNEKGKFIADVTPFHCKCHEVDEWGIYNSDDVSLDRLTGETGGIYLQENTPFKDGVGSLLEDCVDQKGNARLCWKDPTAQRPLLNPTDNCAAYGARRAQTMSYVSISMGEVLSLATFRTDGFVAFARFSRPYAIMLLFNLTVLLSVLRVPVIRDALNFEPLHPRLFLIALIPAAILVILNEIIKVGFRAKQREQHLELGMRDESSEKAKIIEDGEP
jgi:magnesium-transporting ATPase (P-type)